MDNIFPVGLGAGWEMFFYAGMVVDAGWFNLPYSASGF
jgi:hypothetical protein